ncbi:MAG: hypothetical protein IPK60_06160 [Sandaracinaceae bacterium]|nr:hypothetical protein [Sandaracinaceae bacterium]
MGISHFVCLQATQFLFSGSAAFLVTIVFGVAVPLAMALYQWLCLADASERKGQLVASQRPRANFVSGRSALAGTVELLDDNPHPVALTIIQQGDEGRHRNQQTFSWVEVERKLETHLFALRLDSGEKVLVTPAAKVVFVDSLGKRAIFKHRFGLGTWLAFLVLANALVFRTYYTDGGLTPATTMVGFLVMIPAYLVAGFALVHRSPWYRQTKLTHSGIGALTSEHARTIGI